MYKFLRVQQQLSLQSFNFLEFFLGHVLSDIRKSIALLKSYQFSLTYFTDKIAVKKKVTMGLWWNVIGKGKPST